MEEQACEQVNTCDTDQLSFKAYFSSWLAGTSLLAPFTSTIINSYLSPSAKAAATQCDAGSSGTQCGFKWSVGTANDGTTGIGQSMSALGVLQSSIVAVPVAPGQKPPAQGFAPVTNSTGGTSEGNPTAGISQPGAAMAAMESNMKIGVKDKVAASFLTVAVLGGVIGGSVVMVFER
jgi:mannan endo-1,6-alpha-mannosidase